VRHAKKTGDAMLLSPAPRPSRFWRFCCTAHGTIGCRIDNITVADYGGSNVLGLTRRRISVGVAALTCLTLAVIVLYFPQSYHRRTWFRQTESIDQGTFNRIQDGMTKDEVEKLLGLPPGEWITQRVELDSDHYYGFPHPYIEWTGNYGRIRVWFDKRERVERKEFIGTHALQPTFEDRIIRWFRTF
jgi:hypothetical protein